MRQQLAKLGSKQRFTFRGKFERYGYKRYDNHYSPTLLLTNIQVLADDGHYQDVTDHLWFNLTKGFQQLGFLNQTDVMQFNGRVNDYYKGYFTSLKRHDMKVSYPSKITLVNARQTIPLPNDKNAIVGLIMNLEWSFYTSNNRPIDDYCLQQFKDSKENQQHDYHVTVHTGALAARIDYFGSDDDQYDNDDDGVPVELKWQQEARQAHLNKRIIAGKQWLDDHRDDVDIVALQGIVQDVAASRKSKTRRMMKLLRPVFGLDDTVTEQDEMPCRQVKNNVMLYLATL